MPRLALAALLTLAWSGFAASAQGATCTPGQLSDLSTTYNAFRSATRAGDLKQVKALSSLDVAAQILSFEKTTDNPAALARQMGGVMPVLTTAKSVACERSGKRARLIVGTDAVSESGQRVPVWSVVMFEQGQGRGWLVGNKAATSPFTAQPVSVLLEHKELQLP